MQTMSHIRFNEQWSVEELPPGDTGIELLKDLADMHSEFNTSYIRRIAWANEIDAFISADPLWIAYTRHVADRPHCNDL